MRKTRLYHGSPLKIIGLVKPRFDPRTGERGVWLTTNRDSAHAYALLSSRAESSIEHFTKAGKFVRGEVTTRGRVLPFGYIYKFLLPESLVEKTGSHTRISRKPVMPLTVTKITRADAERIGWRFASAPPKHHVGASYLMVTAILGLSLWGAFKR